MRSARFIETAKLELLDEVAYYESKEPGLGGRFLAAVQEAVGRALLYPLTGSPCTQNTRRLLIKDFPFAVVYRNDKTGIMVYAIAHLARRPGFWRSRIDNR